MTVHVRDHGVHDGVLRPAVPELVSEGIVLEERREDLLLDVGWEAKKPFVDDSEVGVEGDGIDIGKRDVVGSCFSAGPGLVRGNGITEEQGARAEGGGLDGEGSLVGADEEEDCIWLSGEVVLVGL